MSIQNALNTAVFSKLSGGTALTSLLGGTAIYYQQAPDDQALPFVVFDIATELDENMTANDTKNCIIFVRGFASTPSLAGSIDWQCDALLNKADLTVSGYANFWTRREDGFKILETDAAGVRTYMSGAQYRVRLDKN